MPMDTLVARKKSDLVACMCGMVHHLVVVTIGVALLYANYSTGYVLAPAELHHITPFVYGYLLGDTIFYCTVEAMGGRFEYLIHHIVGMMLIGGALNAKDPMILLFAPHMLITEISTFLFGLGYCLRSSSLKHSPLVNQVEIAFCITFTLTRIVNMPYRIYLCWPHMDELGVAKYYFLPIMGLQLFWFYKIVTGVTSKYIMKEKKKEAQD